MTHTHMPQHGAVSPQMKTRLKKRKRAEARLKLYGVAAITLAALALVALLWSVVGKAGTALTETYITFDVPLDPSDLDPKDSRDPSEIGRADFGGLAKDVLKDTFPDVSSRSLKRELYDLVSVGAAYELRDAVMADPSLLGRELSFAFLASDVIDLYAKGIYGRFEPVETNAPLRLLSVGAKGEVVLESSEAVFTPILAGLGAALRSEARRAEALAARQQNAIEVYTERAADLTGEAAEENAALLAKAEADQAAARAEAQAIRGRIAALTTDQAQEALDARMPSAMIQIGEAWVKLLEVTPNSARGELYHGALTPQELGAGDWALLVNEMPEAARKVSDHQAVWFEALQRQDQVSTSFNWRFFSAGDSREPELAGIWGAIVGSFWTMAVTFILAFPIGVMAAIYLEEFAPKNKITDLIEVNINNLAAVPSIVFGLLGLAVFLGVFGVPRSAPLAGGIVLALMTLPTIIIAARAAIRAVPPSIRDAALGLGASRLQTSTHHVLPLAMPGILTGTIIGMAQALGETAPLIMIGMVAFIVDIPEGVTDSASVLPVQVFRWADFPERGFEARTAAAICVLLAFLVIMNALAVFLRKRFERRW